MVGSGDAVARGMRAFVDRMQPDELIVVSHIYDHAARLRSYEIAAEVAAFITHTNV
jgi:alkanesulfonate monooxygenase SsuD/methylene tetrahydromethanopterin reductase-like flavin-dependent oxidoreductase (luciferase family)